ncbi:MAG TPA: molybdopterin-dependent oxidoreductase [Acidimicrobiia bacterium]|jgi:anaerobic selenocysteine-containing dehydrogenase|nr:molybdopterin-dependent oxidoreductase [Acidimicrobiia bacterium]
MRELLGTACPLDCPDTCSLTVTVDDGRLVAVDAGPGNPLTDGFICQKVKHHAQRVYAPERVLTPLVRTGEKGAGEFRAASWDEALDLVVSRMRDAAQRFGAQSVVPYVYNSSAPAMQSLLVDRFFKRFGASRVDHTICAATHGAAWFEMFGDMLSADPRDVVHSRLIVVWGANPTVSNVHFPPLVNEARRNGARLVVVDPRRTGMARRADRHLAPTPGTDVVLALAMAAHLERANLLDDAFLSQHAEGVDEYLEAARRWTPEVAAPVCGIAATEIAEAAEELAASRPAMVRAGWGLERSRNGGSACASVFALPVLTGQFGVPGAGIFASLSEAAPLTTGPSDPAERHDPRPRHVNMNRLGAMLNDDDLDPPIAVLFVQGANPAASNPNQRAVHAGLLRDDLFTVVHDQVITDTARFADVVLPATTHFEARDLAVSYGAYVLQETPQVIDRVGESRSNNELGAALAERFDYPAERFDADPATVLGGAVTDAGGASGARPLRDEGETVQFRDTFPSFASKRVQLARLTQIRVPTYQPLDSEYPLALISPSSPKTINSMFGEFDGPEAVVRVHPDDASPRALVDGAMVRVFNELGAVELPVRFDADLRAGVVSIPKGLWCRATKSGLTANALTPDSLSDLAGGATFNDARVEIAAAS